MRGRGGWERDTRDIYIKARATDESMNANFRAITPLNPNPHTSASANFVDSATWRASSSTRLWGPTPSSGGRTPRWVTSTFVFDLCCEDDELATKPLFF